MKTGLLKGFVSLKLHREHVLYLQRKRRVRGDVVVEEEDAKMSTQEKGFIYFLPERLVGVVVVKASSLVLALLLLISCLNSYHLFFIRT